MISGVKLKLDAQDCHDLMSSFVQTKAFTLLSIAYNNYYS